MMVATSSHLGLIQSKRVWHKPVCDASHCKVSGGGNACFKRTDAAPFLCFFFLVTDVSPPYVNQHTASCSKIFLYDCISTSSWIYFMIFKKKLSSQQSRTGLEWTSTQTAIGMERGERDRGVGEAEGGGGTTAKFIHVWILFSRYCHLKWCDFFF